MMKYYVFMIASVISIPVSIISLTNVIILTKSVDKLETMVARQHDLNPTKLKANTTRLPLIRRTITFEEVKFDESGKATVTFKDSVIDKTIFSQVGCPSIAGKIGKAYHVDYNTKTSVYMISCKEFKGK